MKVRVKTEFKDKHTGELHKAGHELEMSVERINEVLKAGGFIELVAEQVEQVETERSPADNGQEQNEDVGEQAEETPKQAGRRKRSR